VQGPIALSLLLLVAGAGALPEGSRADRGSGEGRASRVAFDVGRKAAPADEAPAPHAALAAPAPAAPHAGAPVGDAATAGTAGGAAPHDAATSPSDTGDAAERDPSHSDEKGAGTASSSSKRSTASRSSRVARGSSAPMGSAALPGLPLPRGKETFLSLGEKALAEGDVDRGLVYLEAAVSVAKTKPAKRELLLRVARLARGEGLHPQAIRCYKRLLIADLPDSLDLAVRVELGSCLAMKGDAAAALAAWDSALARADGDGAEALVRRTRADALVARGHARDALDDLRALAARGRDAAERIYAGYRLGTLLAADGKSDEALAAFAGVPSDAAGADAATAYFARAALVRRADLLYRAGRRDESVPLYERVVASWPSSAEAPWALLQVANAARRAARFDEARSRYEELLARWPESRWAPMAQWGARESIALAEASG
jgi:tetratricopeptide (TPR) repeat protein